MTAPTTAAPTSTVRTLRRLLAMQEAVSATRLRTIVRLRDENDQLRSEVAAARRVLAANDAALATARRAAMRGDD